MEQNTTPDPEPVEGDFPAIAAEEQQAPLVEKRYRVTGTQAVFGWNPGEEFNATFTPEKEEYYLNGGHLKVATDQDEPRQEVQASVEVKPEVTDTSDPQE